MEGLLSTGPTRLVFFTNTLTYFVGRKTLIRPLKLCGIYLIVALTRTRLVRIKTTIKYISQRP